MVNENKMNIVNTFNVHNRTIFHPNSSGISYSNKMGQCSCIVILTLVRCSGKVINITDCECVSVALVIQQAKRIHRVIESL